VPRYIVGMCGCATYKPTWEEIVALLPHSVETFVHNGNSSTRNDERRTEIVSHARDPVGRLRTSLPTHGGDGPINMELTFVQGVLERTIRDRACSLLGLFRNSEPSAHSIIAAEQNSRLGLLECRPLNES
jgi:hypothetical protein